MKKKFRYDDNLFWTLITIFGGVLLLSFAIILRNYIFAFIIFLICFILCLFSAYMTNLKGITFNYKKNKLLIYDAIMYKKIDMKNISYFTISEIKKEKRNKIYGILHEPFYPRMFEVSSNYVYSNGKTFHINIFLKQNEVISLYYGWMYKAKSKKRIQKQLNKFNKLVEEFKINRHTF